MNTNFGKLVDGAVEYAPSNIRYKNTYYCPATDDILKKAGYKKIVEAPYPDDGNLYVSKWEETSKEIIRVWVEVPRPEPEPLTPAEQRELAYETELICKYGDGVYTVDYMNKLWYEYSAEGQVEKVAEIQEIIATAKAEIRERYPD